MRTVAVHPAEPDPLLGASLGEHRLTRELGRGGMGVVYEADDTRLGRRVAVKVMRPELAARPEARQRFLHEARAAAALNHEHVVVVHHADEAPATDHFPPLPYLVMPLLRGESLEARLAREGRLPIAEVVRLGREAALGLAVAHAAGLVHRDVKPANLWLEDGPQRPKVKLLDFGLARAADRDEPVLGHESWYPTLHDAPQFAAPELLAGNTVDARADLFSLGVVLYRATTGRLPFAGEDVIAVLRSVAVEAPRPPHALCPDVPRPLSQFILRLIRAEPSERPGSAAEVADALAAFEPRGFVARRRWSRLVLAATVVLGLALIVAVLFLLATPSPLEEKPVPVAAPPTFPLAGAQPLDALRREGVPERAPAELVAVFGDRRFKGHGALSGLEFHPSGRHVFAWNDLLVLNVWDVESGRLRYQLPPASPPIPGTVPHLFALSPDGKWLAEGWVSGVVRVHDAATGRFAFVLPRTPQLPVQWLAFSPGSDRIAVRFQMIDTSRAPSVPAPGSSLLVWDVNTRKGVWSAAAITWAVVFSADGRSLVGYSPEKEKLLRWEAAGGKSLPETPVPTRGRRSWLTPHGLLTLEGAGTEKATVRVHDLETGGERFSLRVAPTLRPEVVAMSPDGRLLAVGAVGSVHLFDGRSGEPVREVPVRIPRIAPRMLAFSPDARTLALGEPAVGVYLIDAETGRPRLSGVEAGQLRLRSPNWAADVMRFACSADGRFLARTVLTEEGRYGVRVFDPSAPDPGVFLDAPETIQALAFRPDGDAVAAATVGGRLIVWDRTSGEVSLNVVASEAGLRDVAWSADGRTLTAAASDDTQTVWDARTGERLGSLSDPDTKATGRGALHPTGRLLAVLLGNKELQLWTPPPTGDGPPQTLTLAREDTPYPATPVWSADGRSLAVGGRGIREWRVTPGTEGRPAEVSPVRRFGKEDEDVVHVACHPAGHAVAGLTRKNMLLVWDTASGRVTHRVRVGAPRAADGQLRFSPDGRHLLLTNADDTLHVYRLAPPAP